MRRSQQHPSRIAVVGALACLSILLLAISSVKAESGPGFAPGSRTFLVTPGPFPNQIYLPLMMKRFPLETLYGVEMAAVAASNGLDLVADAQVTWVRRNGVVWSELQPQKDQAPDWAQLSGLEQELINAFERDLQVILVIRGTPVWARLYPDSQCGPIKPSEYGSFASFVAQLVGRYKEPPYGVKYWQIWNEPDAPVNNTTNPYGCWGDTADAAYYGGDDYGRMLVAVYPAIKAADPAAQVLIGGLLLDCDPAGGCGPGSQPPEAARFLDGILAAGAGGSFDGVAFHAYDHYAGQLGHYNNPNWQSSWDGQGPVVAAKAAFLREALAARGVGGKYLLNTETALICGAFADPPGQGICSSDPNLAFELTKADYLAQTYGAALAEGLRANIWYSVLGWRNSALLNGDLTPRPAYQALAYARVTLPDPVYQGKLTAGEVGGASVLGYKFAQGGRTVWLLWSTSTAPQSIALASPPSEVRNSRGEADPELVDGILSPGKTLYLIWS